MASNSFKVKNSLVLTPKDLSTLVSPEAGDLACDINDNNKIKRYDANAAAWVEVGSGGVGGVDILFVQDFESASLSSFTQSGLVLSQTDPLKGKVSAVLNHDSESSFKQIIPVDRKFRGQTMVLRLDSKSDASQGNLVINIYDETNAANLVASEQLQLSSDVSGSKSVVSFTLPESCASLSYTITALAESGKVSRIDDIICELAETALLETAVEVPVITSQSSIAGGALAAGAQFTGTYTTSGSGVYSDISGVITVLKEAVFNISFSATNATTTTVIPAIEINGIAVSQDNSPAVSSNNSSSSYTGKLAAGTTISFQNNGPGNAGSTSISVSAICHETTTKTIPLTQSGLVQEADSFLYAAGNAGQAITANTTNIPFTFVNSKGSAISYTGSSFTVDEDGIYEISTSVFFTTSVSRYLCLYENGASVASLTIALSTSLYAGSISRFLSAGSTYSIRSNDGGGTLINTPFVHYLNVTKQGSLKQVSVNPNSKITIPTSELRMEGASTRGSTATAIVRFDNVAKLRGDAFTVESDSVLGTRITMRKAGRLSVNANVYINNASGGTYISKNQASLTTTPTASEILSAGGSSTTVISPVSWTGDVAIGDIIRISTNLVPTANATNNLNLSFQEQEIAVSVSNTLPQFSESDSSVRVDTANGYGSTGTRIRRFSNVRDNIGGDIEYVSSAINGDSFIVKESGLYSISYTDVLSGASNIGISKNASSLSTDIASLAVTERLIIGTTALANYSETVAIEAYLVAGDVIRAHTNGTTTGSTPSLAQFTISKVGKPNVTGVDVTPFVNVPQPVSQSSYLAQTASFASASVTGSLISNTNNGIFSYNSSTGVYTALKPLEVTISFSFTTGSAAASVGVIQVNGSIRAVGTTPVVSGQWATTSWTGKLNAGETFNARIDSAVASSQQIINVTATALSDAILTAPETFSTDTAALTYASSSLYNLTTLANAPVGTYITFTYAANTNTRTQTTTRPTQTDADMNANGMLIYTRAYNAASTAGNPAAFAIQIGKGLKGLNLALYKNIGKAIPGGLDYFPVGAFTAEVGLRYKDYNENTGILTLDAGVRGSAVTTSFFEYSDITSQTSGYLVINASKNPALTGLGLNRVAARAVNSSGTSIAVAGTTIPWDAAKTFDTHNALNAAAGVYTAPESGYYQVNASFVLASDTYTVNQKVYCHIVKNGVDISGGLTSVMTTSAVQVPAIVSDIVYLVKGDTLSIKAYADSGPTALIANSTYNFLSIAKVSV